MTTSLSPDNRKACRISMAGLVLPPCGVLLGLLVWGWFLRDSVPDIPIFEPDTWGYLNPALIWISGKGFLQTHGRDWLYPAFVAMVLQVSGSLSSLAVLQKLLGVFCGIFVAATWAVWISMLKLDRPLRLVALLAGSIPVYFQMMSPQIIGLELRIRPEGIHYFFIYLQLFLLVSYCRYRWHTPKVFPSILFGALAILFASVNETLKPSWLFAAWVTALPVFIGIFGRALPLHARILAPGIGLALAVLLILVPARIPFVPDTTSITFVPGTLFTIHAGLIKTSMEKRVASMAPEDPRKPQMERILESLKRELITAQTRKDRYEVLGHDPDYLLYESELPSTIRKETGGSDAAYREFCMTAFFNAVSDNPVGMAGKTASQMGHFLFPSPSTFFRSRLPLGKTYESASPLVDQMLPKLSGLSAAPMMQNYRESLESASLAAPELEGSRLAGTLSSIVAWVAFPLEIIFMLALLACHLRKQLFPLRLAAWIAALFFAAPASNAFLVAMVHSLDITRYRISFGGVLLFALTAMSVIILLVVRDYIMTALGKKPPSIS